MILVDTNLLLYAYVQDVPQHPAAFAWLEERLREGTPVALPWHALLGFVRLVSNHRIFKSPVTILAAWEQVERWLSAPSVWSPSPTPRHAEILGKLLQEVGADSNGVPDAHLAALAIEHDLTLCTSDGGFSRFTGLRRQNPLRS
ncbi:MAG: type II toxin-antitoxin system VapC family toxin [Acidobacteria bacterium]|nr:type II toxin-antitoxin system VapC family toxin [Acidobacteriota bacterium]